MYGDTIIKAAGNARMLVYLPELRGWNFFSLVCTFGSDWMDSALAIACRATITEEFGISYAIEVGFRWLIERIMKRKTHMRADCAHAQWAPRAKLTLIESFCEVWKNGNRFGCEWKRECFGGIAEQWTNYTVGYTYVCNCALDHAIPVSWSFW